MSDRDTLDPQELRIQIQEKYREVASKPDGNYHFFTGRTALGVLGYPAEAVEGLPEAAISAFAGVANPFSWGMPPRKSRVVDVGSGGGLDSIIAARAVGKEGEVVGVDMTPEMLDRASAAATDLELGNLDFRLGLAEDLPVEDGWADLVISNGVLNLVADKMQAYREIRRVLRPGGRLQVADIYVEKPLPEAAKRDIDLWSG